MKHNPGFEALIEQARKHVKEVNIHEVKQHIDKNTLPVLIDVREESEWNSGHIPHAEYLGRGILEREIEKHIPDFNTHIILYCKGGFRSVLAAESLQKMGYTSVESMAGGYTAWTKANYPIVNTLHTH